MGLFNFKISKREKVVVGLEGAILRTYVILAGLVFVGLIFAFSGFNPIQIYLEMISVAFFKEFGITQTILNFIPLAIIAIGIAIPARAKIDNIGAEGQYIIGAMAGYWVAIRFPDFPSFILIPMMIVGAFFAGALWALPIALFRVKGGFKGIDVVVSFLLVFPAELFLLYMITDDSRWGILRFTQSKILPDNAIIATFTDNSIPITIFLSLIILYVMSYFFYKKDRGIPKTKIAYEIHVIGNNETAGQVAGISFLKIALITTAISGGLAGIAGISQLAGNPGNYLLRDSFGGGFGFTAIAVAWLGGLNPIGILFAAFLFAGLLASSPSLQLNFGLPNTAVDLLNGAILLFVLLSEFFVRYKITRRED
ncbi:MAG: ABC transporter permease [Candidatus Heimdallarchaeota archaeon]|nr:ABC transporter permease [Candidatus Heimdallarchaeota archaeon]